MAGEETETRVLTGGEGRGGHWEPEQPRWVSELQSSFISLSVRFELVSFFTPFFLKLQKKDAEPRKSFIFHEVTEIK